MNTGSNNLLIIGIDNSSLAYSAKKVGYDTFTIDYFGDLDVRRISDDFISVIEQKPGVSSGRFEENYSPKALLQLFEVFRHQHKFMGTLLSSGLDDSFNVLYKINEECKIIGNSPETIRTIRDKKKFFQKLEKVGVSQPETLITSSLDLAIKKAKDIGYPLILKPSEGFAGTGIRKVHDQQQLVKEFRNLSLHRNKEIVVQEYIKGTPASISFMAAYPKSKIIALNEQLLGLKKVYQPEPFGYCGNITPYLPNRHTMKRCKKIVEKITYSFQLMGSNGVDLVISEDDIPYVIEVNPRFQGSLGCIERVYGINLVKLHLEACKNKKIEKNQCHPSLFSTRLIIYAPKRITAPDLVSKPSLRDVPCPGSIIEEGEPICSIISDGLTRDESLKRAQETARSIFNHVLN